MTTLNSKILEIARTQVLFERGPARDPHIDVLAQHRDLDGQLRRYAPPVEAEPIEERDAAEFFAAEQCPSDATFR